MDNFQNNVTSEEQQPQFSGNYQQPEPGQPVQNVDQQFMQGGMYGQPVQPKKNSIGSRIGYFFLSCLPILLCLILQFICVFVVLFVALFAKIFSTGVDPTDYNALMNLYMEVAVDAAPAGVVTYHIVGTIVFGLWYYLSFKKPRPGMKAGFKKVTPKCLIASVVCGIAMCLLANGTVAIESVIVPDVVEAYIEMAETAGLGTDLFVIFASIILAPIGEEFVCRGLTLKFGKKCFGNFWVANVFQALMFGLIHMNWVQGIYAFLIGLVLGWLVERYDSILPAMLMHCVVNFSSSTYIPYLLAPVPSNLVSGLILIVIPGVIVLAVMKWASKSEETVSAGQ